MNKMIILLLLVYAVIEFYIDFKIKTDKGSRGWSLIVNIVGSVVITFMCILPFWEEAVLLFVGIFLVLHILSRIGRFLYTVVLGKEIIRLFFIVRQIVMLTVIVTLAWVFSNISAIGVATAVLITNIPIWEVLKVVLTVLLVTRPINIIFKNLFPDLKPPDISRKKSSYATQQIGGLIGSMERILIIIFLLAGEYVAIGFVFTAKSITRYRRISIQREFAEYYLLGTLYSILAALVVYGVIFKLL